MSLQVSYGSRFAYYCGQRLSPDLPACGPGSPDGGNRQCGSCSRFQAAHDAQQAAAAVAVKIEKESSLPPPQPEKPTTPPATPTSPPPQQPPQPPPQPPAPSSASSSGGPRPKPPAAAPAHPRKPAPKRRTQKSIEQWLAEHAICMHCGSGEREAEMLLCDGPGCTAACHLGCCNPPLKTVPEGDWFCALCDQCLRGDQLPSPSPSSPPPPEMPPPRTPPLRSWPNGASKRKRGGGRHPAEASCKTRASPKRPNARPVARRTLP